MSTNQYINTTEELDGQRSVPQSYIEHSLAVQARLKEPKTSTSHPINISWMIPPNLLQYLSVAELPFDLDLYDLLNPSLQEKVLKLTPEQQQQLEQPGHIVKGNLCLSSCPGKKVRLSGPVRGRATINRDLNLDFARMKSFGITTLVCCLDDNELDFLGAPWPKYEAAANIHQLKIIRLPMIEGRCPNTLDEIVDGIERVNNELSKGDNVLVHCRGGVGRAGLFAACWLLENMMCQSAERAVQFLREQRSPKAIETNQQAVYIIQYMQALKKRLGLRDRRTEHIQEPFVEQICRTGPPISLISKMENDSYFLAEVCKAIQ